MANHTPGPWFQSHRKSVYGGYRTEIYTEDGEVVATAAWYPRKLNETTTTTDRAANARLIAAAPELLGALEEMVRWYAKRETASMTVSGGEGLLPIEQQDEEVQQAMRAIAKATSP